MKTFLTLILIIIISTLVTKAQQKKGISISGKLIDKETQEPVIYANIFLANTTIGTTSDNNGEFFFRDIPYGNYNIIFSHVGYESEIRKFDSYQPYRFKFEISLIPKVIQLKQISITASFPEEWEKDFKIFNQIFIGETENARYTEILNPEVLNFEKEEKTGKFKAYSDSVLRVENRALGYNLHIVFDSLVFIPNSRIIYKYYPKFEEMTPISDEEKEEWEENREKTYLDSPRHFFYSMVHNQLPENYFTLRKSSGILISPEYLDLRCIVDSSIYELRYKGDLEVDHYIDKKSILKFYYPSVRIDKKGNLLSNYYSVEKSGYWAKQRIADTLPNDYVIKGN